MSSKTVAQLRQEAMKRKVPYAGLKKDQLLVALGYVAGSSTSKVVNPLTGNAINRGGALHLRLMREGKMPAEKASTAVPKKVSPTAALKEMTMAQLRLEATRLNIPGRSKLNKEGLLAAVLQTKDVPASPKKASPKKASPKKASPKKASPKKASPKKASPKKASPKKIELGALTMLMTPSARSKETATVCVSESIGRRPTMEDAFAVATMGDVSFYGVFDGHVGRQVADILVESLPRSIHSALSIEGLSLSDETKVRTAIIKAYLQLDHDIFQNAAAGNAGSAATVVLQIGRKLYFVNLGDSRSVLVNAKREVVHETKDHKPSEERDRMEQAGAIVMQRGKQSMAMTKYSIGVISMSRAFGDKSFKIDGKGKYLGTSAALSPYPDITVFDLKEEPYTLILACDGLWDGVSSAKAAEYTKCPDLLNAGLRAPGYKGDNVTVMIVKIAP